MKNSLFCLVFLYLFFPSSSVYSQNDVTVQVSISPPYSPYLSTYADQPNKVLLTIINNTTIEQELKLWVKISGDNGASVTTRSDFNPSMPITLAGSATQFISFNTEATRDYFDANNVDVVGMTKAELIQNQALPEGNYQICVRALQYSLPHAPKSMDACFFFPIAYIDPPVLMQPTCGNDVLQTNPQFMLFSWTPPATAPGNIQYEFTLKEVPNTLNPNDVIKNSVFPVLFNTTQTANPTLAYTVAFPQLEPGKKYVWRVKAVDPTNSVQFKNAGYSEACVFTYKSNSIVPVINPNINVTEVVAPVITNIVPPAGAGGGFDFVPMVTEDQGVVFIPPLITLSQISGQAKYRYPNESSKFPLKKATVRLLVGYEIHGSNGQPKPGYGFNTSSIPDHVADGEELAVTTTDEDGNFSFSFLATFPFGNVQDGFTSGSGEFKSTGTLYRYAYIKIEYPHAEFYEPVFPNKFAPTGGENMAAGEITTTVKSAPLHVSVKNVGGMFDELNNTSQYLADANVYLCRKKVYSQWQKDYYPAEDGSPDNQVIEKPAALNGLEIVAKGKTNKDGVMTFKRMVNHTNPNFRYYVYADFPKDANDFVNYSPKYGAQERSYTCNGGFMCTEYFQEFKVESNFPRVHGWLEDETDGKRIPGFVFLKSTYIGFNNENIILKSYMDSKEISIADKMNKDDCPCNGISSRLCFAGKDGRFEFANLPIKITTGNVSATGPARHLEAVSAGYDEIKYKSVKSPLLEGQQAFVKLSMSRGAKISGKVVDGETGKGISCTFYFTDEVGHSGYTFSDEDAQWENYNNNENPWDANGNWVGQNYVSGGGKFKNYPSKKMPISQKLVFKSDGYITDTLTVTINEKTVDLGTIKLFTLKRRLRVKVLDAVTHNIIKDATVMLSEVKKSCMIEQGSGTFKAQVPGECPIVEKAPLGVTPVISFVNAGGPENNAQKYTIKVYGPSGTEYVETEISTKIPYASKPKEVTVYLEPGTCVSGYVYAGKTNSSPVQGAKVKVDIVQSWGWGDFQYNYVTGEVEAATDASGKYTLHRVPLRSYGVMMRAMKSQSQLVGDSFSVVTDPKGNINAQMGGNISIGMPGSKPVTAPKPYAINQGGGDGCIHHDFHLTVYNDMDITSLMGFPISVTELNPVGTSSAKISGYFDELPDNAQFKAKSGQQLSFTNVNIVPGTLKNTNNVPVSQPSATPVETNNNELKLSVFGVDGKVEDKNLGIYLDKTLGGSQYGVVKGKVHLSATEFNQTVVGLTDDPYLILPTGTDKMKIPVFNADKTVSNPASVPSGFGICNQYGGALTFSLPGFPDHAKTDLTSSKFVSTGELQMATKIETNIPNVTPANLNLDLGVIKLKKGATPVINNSQPISFKLGTYWTINSTDWKLDENGLKMNKGKLNTGVEFPIENIVVQYDKLLTNSTKVTISDMKLAKVHPVNITSGQMTFGEIYYSGSNKVWQIYVAPAAGGSCGYINNLPGIGSADKITLGSINLYSNGQKNVFMKKSDLMLRNVLPYHTDESSILVSDESFTIGGMFDLNIPDKHSYSAALIYEKGGTTLKDLAFINIAPIIFNQPTALAHQFMSNHTLTNGMFKVSGTAEETGAFPKTKTTLYYTKDSVSVWIDGGQNIPINGDKKFGKAEGGMRIQAGNWTPFWFDGEMQGMPGVSDVLVNGKPQRMKFIVEGDISADDQSITMSDVSTPFGNMSWTYNFPQSQLVGHCDIDMNLGSTLLKGGITSVVDGGGWYFSALGKITIQGVGDADLMGIFGNYNTYPQFLSTGMGDMKCLPSAFQSNVKGFLFQAGIHKQVVPNISFEIPALLSVDFGVDLGLTTRIWKSFGGSGQYGISLLAKGVAHANGSCDATCSSIGAEAVAEVGISGVYNSSDGSYGVNGCASVGFQLTVEQCLGALGLCGPCVSVDSGHKDIGINVSYTSSAGADLGIVFGACDSQCN